MYRLRLLAVVALAGLVSTGCDNGSAAQADSLKIIAANQVHLMGKLAAQKDSLTRVVLDADAFIAGIDSQISTVKGVRGKARKNALKQFESPIDEQVHNRKEMMERVQALVKRAKATADELAASREREQELKGETVRLQGENEQLRARIDEDQKLIAQFSETIERQAAAITTLETRVDSLVNETKTLGAKHYTAYYIIAPEGELVEKGIAVREGGANLLIKRVGRSLQPARKLESEHFTMIDQRDVQVITVPDSTKRYRLVSRQNLDFAEVEDRDGLTFRGNLKITDYNRFWGPSRYLILAIK